MVWRPYQQARLAQERAILSRFLPDFEFYSLLENTYVSGWWASSQQRSYQIRVNLPPTFPDAPPDTYLCYPTPLYGYGREQLIEDYGTSHTMHVWKTDRPGWVKLCIMRPENWSGDFSIVKILQKAMLWITAYECHLDDGRLICEFLMND